MLEGKVVAITGAGSGIGQALAVECAERGARLALSGRNDLEETFAMLPKWAEARAYVVDVSSREAVFAYAEAVRRHFGAAHFVFNNAGTSILVTLTSRSKRSNSSSASICGASFMARRRSCRSCSSSGRAPSSISRACSVSSRPHVRSPTPSRSSGCAGLTETLWQELDGTGVRAILVHPGGINTNIAKNSPHAQAEGDFERFMTDLNVSQMITPPSECARTILTGIEAGKKRILVGNGAEDLFMLSRAEPDEYGSIMKPKFGL